MLINALQRANNTQRSELEMWIATNNCDEQEKIKAVTALYNAIGIKGLCQQKIESYFLAAEESLTGITIDENRKSILREFALSLMKRNV